MTDDNADIDQELIDDNSPERPTKDESTTGRIAAAIITSIPKPLLGVRGTLFKRMAIKSIENYHKAVGGDAIAINAKPGQQIALEPVAYRSPEELDEGEAPGWRVKGRDKVWNPGAEGNSVNYLGRTPTVLLEDDDHVEAGWLAPRVGTAIELDNYWPIFRNAEINAVVDYQPGAGATNGGAARADGGANIELELDHPGEWAEDNIVDLDSGDNYDGMRISTKKAREWRAEHTDSEQMQQQEDRGYLMGLAKGEDDNGLRYFIYAAVFALLVIGLVVVGPELAGGGGGGGGSINPLMTALGAFGVV